MATCTCVTQVLAIVYRDSQEYFIHVPHSKEVAVVIVGVKVDTSACRHCHYHKRYSCHRRSNSQLKCNNYIKYEPSTVCIHCSLCGHSNNGMWPRQVGGGIALHASTDVHVTLHNVSHTPRYEWSPEHIVTDIWPKHFHQLQVEMDCLDSCPEEVRQHEIL